jgi:hypothetical protein
LGRCRLQWSIGEIGLNASPSWTWTGLGATQYWTVSDRVLKRTNDELVPSSSRAGSATLALTIGQAQPAPAMTSLLAASGTFGVAFSYQIAASNNPTSFNATGLPPGLSVNITTGLISGTPRGSGGTFSVTLSATNAGGTGSATLALTIAKK